MPLEIQEATGVKPVTIGDQEFNLNLAEQLDGPFLGKSMSAGARAKVLGKLAGTEEIDYAQKQLNTDLYRRRQEEKSLAAEITGLEEQIKQFDYLPALAKKIARLEKLVMQINADMERREKLVCTGKKLRQTDEQILEAGAIISRWQGLEQAEVAYSVTENAVLRQQKVVKLKDGLGRVGTAVNSVKDVIARLVGIEQAEEVLFAAKKKTERRKVLLTAGEKLKQTDSDIELAADIRRYRLGVNGAENMLGKTRTAAVQKEKITVLAGKLDKVNKLIQQSKNAVIIWENRTVELGNAYQNQLVMLGICPLCGQTIQKIKETV